MDAIRKIQRVNSDKLVLDVSKYKGKKVEVIILPFSNDTLEINDSVINENDWIYSIKASDAFDFLNDSDEDLYTVKDGKPFYG